MVQWAEFGCTNTRGNPGKDRSGRLRSFKYFTLKRAV